MQVSSRCSRDLAGSLPNRSHVLRRKNSPLVMCFSFLRTNSRFLGFWITTPGGRVGTEISYVSSPNTFWHCTNQWKRTCLGCKNLIELPKIGSVWGGCLSAERKDEKASGWKQ